MLVLTDSWKEDLSIMSIFPCCDDAQVLPSATAGVAGDAVGMFSVSSFSPFLRFWGLSLVSDFRADMF